MVKGPLIIQNTQRGNDRLGLIGRGNFTSSTSFPSPSLPASSSTSHRTGAAPPPTPILPMLCTEQLALQCQTPHVQGSIPGLWGRAANCLQCLPYELPTILQRAHF